MKSRQAVLWALGLLLSGWGTLQWHLNHDAGRLRDPLYGQKLTLLERAWSEVGGTKILALGSSRLDYGLQPIFLGQQWSTPDRPVHVFNFGIPSAGPVTHWIHWQRLRAAGFCPEQVLIEVMPLYLLDQNGNTAEARTHPPGWLCPHETGSLWEWSLAEHRLTLLGHWLPNVLPAERQWQRYGALDSCGGRQWPWPVQPRRTPQQVQATLNEYRTALSATRLNERAMRCLSALLSDCRQCGVTVTLLRMPEAAALRAAYQPQGQYQLRAFIESTDCNAINASDWLPDEAFADGHHLTPAGAKQFTAQLARSAAIRSSRLLSDSGLPTEDDGDGNE